VSGLGSVLDQLAAEPVDGLVVSSEELAGLLVARARLEGELLRRLRVWDGEQGWAGDGALSPTGWLIHHSGLLPGTARRLVHAAHRLGEAPLTLAGLCAGRLSADQAQILARASTAPCTARFQTDEPFLVEQALKLNAAQLAWVVRRWRDHAETEADLEAGDPGHQGRHLHASLTLDGTVAVDGELDPEGGATVLAALEAAMHADRDVPGEPARSRPQRRADALGTICRHYLDTASLPTCGGERPHLAVFVDLPVLTGIGPGRCETDHGLPLPAAVVHQLACDAGIHPIFTRGRSEILDLGRRTRVISAALRRAVVARDRHCRFPGCDRPAGWCDVHHLKHWIHGGRTALDNTLLLCRRHHRLLHHNWTLTGTPTTPVFTRPDGTQLHDTRAGPAP
jgi:hypothetical protein